MLVHQDLYTKETNLLMKSPQMLHTNFSVGQSQVYYQWRNRRGAECPPETFHREIFGDLSGKMRQGKKGLKNGKC